MTFYDAISGKETANFETKIPIRLLAKLKQWEKIIPYVIIANKLIDEQKEIFSLQLTFKHYLMFVMPLHCLSTFVLWIQVK